MIVPDLTRITSINDSTEKKFEEFLKRTEELQTCVNRIDSNVSFSNERMNEIYLFIKELYDKHERRKRTKENVGFALSVLVAISIIILAGYGGAQLLF